MRNGRLIVLMSIVLLLSIAGYFASTALKSPDADVTIYELESDSIAAINIMSQDTGVSFKKIDGKWTMIEPAEYKINEELVGGLAKKLESLGALRVIEKNPRDLNQYGLANPKTSIGFQLVDGKEKTLLIGEETASKYQRYIKDSERDTVYSISLTDAEIFGNGDPSAFRNRNLFTIDVSKVNLLRLNSNGKPELQLMEYEAGKWQFSQPCMANAKNDAVNDILKGVASLTIKDFIEDDPVDLHRYGLDKPAFFLEVGDRIGKLQRISFGTMDDTKKEAFVSLNGGKGVFTISTQDFNPMDIKIGDLLNETPLSIGIGSVKKVIIKDRGTITEFNRELSKPDEDSFSFNGKETKKEDFIALYVDLMALTSEGYDATNTGENQEIEITYESIDGDGTIELALSKRDEKTYFLSVDDQPLPFYLSGQKVELVRRWLKRVVEGL